MADGAIGAVVYPTDGAGAASTPSNSSAIWQIQGVRRVADSCSLDIGMQASQVLYFNPAKALQLAAALTFV